MILSPRAVERINSYTPTWPMPKVFRLKKDGKLNMDIFSGKVINTVSMMAVEDYYNSLSWVESIGGVEECIRRANANLKVVEDFVEGRDWVKFYAEDKNIRSNTSVCLKINLKKDQIKEMEGYLANNNVA